MQKQEKERAKTLSEMENMSESESAGTGSRRSSYGRTQLIQ